MTTASSHLQELESILEAATRAAREKPTAANIAALERARRAVDEYKEAASGGEKFKTQAAALEYLQRNWIIQKSKLSNDVSAGRCPRKDGYFSSRDLDFYATAVHLQPANTQAAAKDDGVDRLKLAMAEEREIRVATLRGNLIDAAEEEARDARLWAAVKSDLENHAPLIVNELVNRVISIVEDEEVRERIHKLTPELRATYEDAVADIFDRYAQAGGIEA